MPEFTIYMLLLTFLCRTAAGESPEDKAALLSFLAQVPHEPRLRWNPSASACSWVGVLCDDEQNRVVSLRLPGIGLAGPIPPATIGRLTALQVLSLRSNRLSGELPAGDLSNLTDLRRLYLQNNAFSGGIPFAVSNLNNLTGLFLQGNNFSGELPSFGNPGLNSLNVSGNDLNGSIPTSLSRFPQSAFVGNARLCGPPLANRCITASSPAPSTERNPTVMPTMRGSRRWLSRAIVIALTVAVSAIALVILLISLVCCCRRRRPGILTTGRKWQADVYTASSSKDNSGVVGGGTPAGPSSRLVFMGAGGLSGGCRFDLEDLLRASAEVLGKGSAGTTYRAVLEEGTTVVVKRLKDVVAGRREFEQQMELVGKMKPHRNVVPLRAYYFCKDEKLIVTDFMAAGSLSALLHGRRGSGRAQLNWDTRMRIAVSAGRGIAHIHAAAGVPHGNIKASNVLLRRTSTLPVSDFALVPLFAHSGIGGAGYQAPEVSDTKKPTVKSDVYSFGVLLLELLTGKSPAAAYGGDAEGDTGLPGWVQSVVREEWTAEVFDSELRRYDGVEEEMVQLLQVAMQCVAIFPDLRPDFSDVLRNVEDLARSDDVDAAGGAGHGPSSSSEPPKRSGSACPTP